MSCSKLSLRSIVGCLNWELARTIERRSRKTRPGRTRALRLRRSLAPAPWLANFARHIFTWTTVIPIAINCRLFVLIWEDHLCKRLLYSRDHFENPCHLRLDLITSNPPCELKIYNIVQMKTNLYLTLGRERQMLWILRIMTQLNLTKMFFDNFFSWQQKDQL